ncbi:methionyl aminopeptidase [Thalassospira sp. MBR-102]|jgi:methionyl aminopeptidase|uniref:Methionine aminopeptidase n=2 Tax=Thalassospira xiamenensis TaxID=220697 RepID=A0ABR5Y254_9PROT|nr:MULTISPECIES: type I methionyl aminopeptidase [Thalassospira]MBR9780864.1 type I methionyl aminopeptidase [Rhodospirillales bacterium]AJD50350.1 methionine aminopeptidase [Thalassospira xiamenensis M-5 = DSM 17429]KZD03569.1 methionine aminopeptidase [Thalassospira xiamenensis]KZD08597.1 methionine aminopeptidase [Thalassospira xiamenensis]MAB35017.1 type I methionyl aminopeptidase [Thalassospira sp.]|tara:strand:+ start:657 stop:1406 length:750 start_codon:yes stop_codon:yes gene_type:complete
MTISSETELEHLRRIGRICARARDVMGAAAVAGMTTAELDAIGRKVLEDAGAVSAPESEYDFPGATCISVNEEVAHGIPGDRVLADGDLVNIDVSASLDGYFSDTGASFIVGTPRPEIVKLCDDGKKAMWAGIKVVRDKAPIREIGLRIENFARKGGYSLIKNLASHGIGKSLHEAPETIPTWDDPRERRSLKKGQVITIEPFLSRGSNWALDGDDGWTLYADTGAPTVQYEHTLVVTQNGYEIMTLAG